MVPRQTPDGFGPVAINYTCRSGRQATVDPSEGVGAVT
jgi:hypothetical protein